MRIMILDVWANDLGFLGPNEFLAAFQGLPIPKVIYKGKITGKFSEEVKLGKYPVEWSAKAVRLAMFGCAKLKPRNG